MAWGGTAMGQPKASILFSVGMSQSSLGSVVSLEQPLTREGVGRA